MSLYPWRPKYSMWYVLMSLTGDVGKVYPYIDDAFLCRSVLCTGRPLWPDSTSRPSSLTSGIF